MIFGTRLKLDVREQLIAKTREAQKNVESPKELFSNLKRVAEDVFDVQFESFLADIFYDELEPDDRRVKNYDGEANHDGLGVVRIFRGKLTYKISNGEFDIHHLTHPIWVNDINDASNIYLGSGGGGPDFGLYEVYFFITDFPKIHLEVNRRKLLKRSMKDMEFKGDLTIDYVNDE